jgi:ABC-type glycerol-3-phosphate transport system substrate-binding protein
MRNFQLITIIVFIALAVLGVLVFSGAIPIGGSGDNAPGSLGTVVAWGTVRTEVMSPLLEEFRTQNSPFSVQYVQKSRDTFDQDLLEALASDIGPDMIFLPDDLAFHYADKVFPIPYQSYPLATFQRTFSSAGEVFLTSGGILALPLSVDPLMMYYSKSMLDANAVIYPPEFWDELSTLTPTLTKKDDANKILKSAVALGHFSNVAHAKVILATLLMQTGNRIVGDENGALGSLLDTTGSRGLASVLDFYTSFADPSSAVYSWNKSFPNSADAFSREDLAFYFGYASELGPLVNKNPNQNFSIAPFPQERGAGFKATGARVTGVAILKSSQNINGAFAAVNAMALGDFARRFALAQAVAPARRDLLGAKPDEDAYSPIFYDSALYARSWLDPAPRDTEVIFQQMVDGVLSNSVTPAEALKNASTRLDFLFLR